MLIFGDHKLMTGAVYIRAMFAFINRVADAFGIERQGYFATNTVTKYCPGTVHLSMDAPRASARIEFPHPRYGYFD